MKLNELRNKIDKIDEEVIRLLIERFEVVEKIMSLKSEIEDKGREKDILEMISELTKNVRNQGFYSDLFKIIFEESKRIQRGKK